MNDASWKICNKFFSLSPTKRERTDDGDTLNSGRFDSNAAASARTVFPVPGGPNRRIHDETERIPINSLGKKSEGRSSASRSARFASLRPMTSLKRGPGRIDDDIRNPQENSKTLLKKEEDEKYIFILNNIDQFFQINIYII